MTSHFDQEFHVILCIPYQKHLDMIGVMSLLA